MEETSTDQNANVSSVWLTSNEVATELGLSGPQVRRLLRGGALKGTKTGFRNWRVRPSDLEAYLATKGGERNG